MSIARIIAAVSVLAATGVLVLTRAEPTQAEGLGSGPDLNAIKSDYRRPAPPPVDNQALVDLGRDSSTRVFPRQAKLRVQVAISRNWAT